MLLGKRPRPTMQRTTSMKEFAPELDAMIMDAVEPSSDAAGHHHHHSNDWLHRGHLATAAVLSPQNSHRRSSGDLRVVETAPFLKACGLCKRRLGPGRDIYMYRGEVAFCSLECRQQLMNQEEQKEKCALSPIKSELQSTAAGSETSGDGGEAMTVA